MTHVRTLSALPLLAALGLAACRTSSAVPCASADRWVDLTHAFDEDTVYWPTAEGFRFEVVFDGQTEKGYHYSANQFACAEHGGTHLDAPIHFDADGWTAEVIPVDRFEGPAAVVDVSARALADPDYLVTTDDLVAWEAEHGRLPEGAILLLHTGYGRYWPDRVKYMGTDARGEAAVADLHFPGLAPEAAAWLVREHVVDAVGLDTPSIDHGQSTLFEAHRHLAAANVLIFENVKGADRLPATGAWVVALPMKIRGGSGGPLRILALLPG